MRRSLVAAVAAACMCVGVGCRSSNGSAAAAPGVGSVRSKSAARSGEAPTVDGPSLDPSKPLYRIAFGSCLDED